MLNNETNKIDEVLGSKLISTNGHSQRKNLSCQYLKRPSFKIKQKRVSFADPEKEGKKMSEEDVKKLEKIKDNIHKEYYRYFVID